MQVDAQRRYTLDDLWDFPGDGRRRELIDGVLYVTPQRVPVTSVSSAGSSTGSCWAEEHGGETIRTVTAPGLEIDVVDILGRR